MTEHNEQPERGPSPAEKAVVYTYGMPSEQLPPEFRESREQARAEATRQAREHIADLGGIRRERVRRDDPRHLRELSERNEIRHQQFSENMDVVFGTGRLHIIDTADPQADDYSQMRQSQLSTTRRELSEALFHAPLEINQLALEIDTVAEHIEQTSGTRPSKLSVDLIDAVINEPDENVATANIRSLIEGLGDDQTESLLRVHAQEVQTRITEREALNEVEPIRRRFTELLAERHAQGAFPLSPEIVEQRLSRIQVMFVDGVILEDSIANQNYDLGLIRLNVDREDDNLEHILFHELLHAIAGVTAITEIPAPPDDAPKGTEPISPDKYSHATPFSRHGLGITPNPIMGRQRRLSWLDEAVIEVQALELSNLQDSIAYPDERRLFATLEARVPRTLFTNAQFEDFEPGQGSPAWTELTAHLNEAFEPNILTILDHIIEEEDVDAAIRYLNNLEARRPTPASA